jgi:hypothetical protein
MELSVNVRKNREEPKPEAPVVWEGIGDEVSIEGTVCQAAQAIDIAGMLAVEQQDAPTLLKVGEAFTRLSDFIMSVSDYKRKNSDGKSDVPMGFQVSNSDDEDKCTK